MKNNTVHFHHIRNTGRGKKDNYTLAILATPQHVFVGIAKCSRRDQFEKAKGRLIAEGRVRKAYEIEKARLPEDNYVNWSLTLDRKEYSLESEQIKREVVAIAESEIRDINYVHSHSSYPAGEPFHGV